MAKDKGCYILDLHEARDALATKSSIFRISLDEFNGFFSEYLAKDAHLISESDFIDLISKFEDEILQMAGIQQ